MIEVKTQIFSPVRCDCINNSVSIRWYHYCFTYWIVAVTEADILYQMLRKANEELSRNGEKAAEFLTDKLKIKVALLNKALNNNDEKTLFSKRDDHPEWFEGLETNSPTKVRFPHTYGWVARQLKLELQTLDAKFLAWKVSLKGK